MNSIDKSSFNWLAHRINNQCLLDNLSAVRGRVVDLGCGNNRLGGSILAQVYGQMGDSVPDVDDAAALKRFFNAVQALNRDGLLLAYHDRSDGGLIVTLVEMAFASRQGLEIDVGPDVADVSAYLFAEEPGAVLQVRSADLGRVRELLSANGCRTFGVIARPTSRDEISVSHGGKPVYSAPRSQLHATWSELTYRMQALRDNPECAQEAYESTLDPDDPGLNVRLTFELPRIDDPARAHRGIVSASSSGAFRSWSRTLTHFTIISSASIAHREVTIVLALGTRRNQAGPPTSSFQARSASSTVRP